tara:strand:- start:3265 stop:4263 length:999 start_codon:yes stop_codon:yes gene_type:complete
MQSFTTEQIINTGKQLGFKYKSFTFSIKGRYKSSDALFNHRDIPHFNHLHQNLAGGYGNEGVYYGDVVSFIRYFKFFLISFPILTLMKDDGKNRVLETYSFFCFQFLKLNEEIDLPESGCESKITYYIGCKHEILLNIFLPFFKKMFKKSFNDYKNDDHPFLNRRADLRAKGFSFNKDDISNFTYEDCLNIKSQNCFFDYKSMLSEKISVNINDIKENELKIVNDINILSFQFYRDKNLIKIYPVVCPHEGGYLGLNNEVGVKFNFENFKNSECKVRCNIHNRRFDPIITIDLKNSKDSYKSNVYDFKINDGNIFINLRNDLNSRKNLDWSK